MKKVELLRKLVIKLVVRIDGQIHPKRIETILSYLKDFYVILILLLVSLCIGVIGFMWIENYSLVDALFMTIITVSTVGYGEVKPLTEGGKLFASLLIVTNIGIFAYAISNMASFIVDGEYRKVIGDIILGRKIDKMKDHIVVCGYGRYGKSVVEHLQKQNLTYILIESDLKKVNPLRRSGNVDVLEGDATDENTLKEAGVDHARALITTLPVDADNVYVILTARQLNPKMQIVSRANLAASKKNMLRAGADNVLIPENIGGFYMSALVTKPDIINVFAEISSLESKTFRLAEVFFDKLPPKYKNIRLKDLDLEKKSGVKIIGVKRGEEEFQVNPSRDCIIEDNSALLILGNQNQIKNFHDLTSEFSFIQ